MVERGDIYAVWSLDTKIFNLGKFSFYISCVLLNGDQNVNVGQENTFPRMSVFYSCFFLMTSTCKMHVKFTTVKENHSKNNVNTKYVSLTRHKMYVDNQEEKKRCLNARVHVWCLARYCHSIMIHAVVTIKGP